MEERELEAKYHGILLMSADSSDRLRRVDVDRTLQTAFDLGCLPGFKTWILNKNLRPETRQTILVWEVE